MEEIFSLAMKLDAVKFYIEANYYNRIRSTSKDLKTIKNRWWATRWKFKVHWFILRFEKKRKDRKPECVFGTHARRIGYMRQWAHTRLRTARLFSQCLYIQQVCLKSLNISDKQICFERNGLKKRFDPLLLDSTGGPTPFTPLYETVT